MEDSLAVVWYRLGQNLKLGRTRMRVEEKGIPLAEIHLIRKVSRLIESRIGDFVIQTSHKNHARILVFNEAHLFCTVFVLLWHFVHRCKNSKRSHIVPGE